MLKNKYLHNFLLLLGFLYFSLIPSYAYWEIDRSEFIRFLCRYEPRACNAPSRIGRYATFQECEIARRSALPNDIHWQNKTRCVGYDEPSRSYTPSQQPNFQQQQEEELRQQRERLKLEQQKAQQEKERYIKELEQKRAEEVQRYKLLSNNMKISSPPIPQSQREEYRKILKQANCIAYNSIQAVELALKGKFEISKKILTDLEIMTDKAKAGFDDRTPINCPRNIEFNIPEPKMSVDQDSVYKGYQEITQSVSNLFLEIQANNEEAKITQDKKQRLQKEMEQLKNELKDLQKKIKRTKKPEKKEDYELLEEEAKILLQRAERNYQIALKNEERLSKEKVEIENKLNDLERQLVGKIEKINK
jgi:chromosome segregation ATPase